MDLRSGVCSQFAAGIRSRGGSDRLAAGRVELKILWGCNFPLGDSLRLVAAEEGRRWWMGKNSLVVGDTRLVELQGEAGLWAQMVAEVGTRQKHVPALLLDLITN